MGTCGGDRPWGVPRRGPPTLRSRRASPTLPRGAGVPFSARIRGVLSRHPWWVRPTGPAGLRGPAGYRPGRRPRPCCRSRPRNRRADRPGRAVPAPAENRGQDRARPRRDSEWRRHRKRHSGGQRPIRRCRIPLRRHPRHDRRRRSGAAIAELRGRTGRIRPRPPGPLAVPVGRCAGAFSAPVSHKSEAIVLSWRGKVVAIFFRYA